MVAYVFPGQGSQTRGMGESLFADFPDLVAKADRILGYSIVKLCLEDPHDQLNKTNFTQPALYVVNALSYFKKIATTGIKPDYLAGHSLGEYNALLAADVFDFETGLKLVQTRGEVMSQASNGGMAAVIGLESEAVQAILDQENLPNISIANYNSFKQVVISGLKESVIASENLFINAGARLFIPLKVSGAFHSRYMQEAQQKFSAFLQDFAFILPRTEVIANVTAKPYPADEVQSLLAQQITQPVRWTQSMEYLLAKGETVFEEIGPGKVLTGLINRIRKGE